MDTLLLEEEMAVKNRYYPVEFKCEALAVPATDGYTMATLERELGITLGCLDNGSEGRNAMASTPQPTASRRWRGYWW